MGFYYYEVRREQTKNVVSWSPIGLLVILAPLILLIMRRGVMLLRMMIIVMMGKLRGGG